jgi:acyl dehydratase
MPHATAVRHKRGGLYFEDFTVGELVEHRYTRTVTQMDNMLFSNMTSIHNPAYRSALLRAGDQWGQPLMVHCSRLG